MARGERNIPVEAALERNTLFFLKERYGKRKGDKQVVELACKEVAALAAKDYLDAHKQNQGNTNG